MKSYKIGKTKRGYHESIRESIHLDISKGLVGVLHQVAVVSCVCSTSYSREKILAFINSAIAYIKKRRLPDNVTVSHFKENSLAVGDETNLENWGDFSVKEKYFCIFRCILLHRRKEVRVSGLRLHRYLIRDEDDIKALMKCNSILLIVRSIDICLDNHSERVLALRLARHILEVSPSLFPIGLARCIVAVAKDGAKVKDRLLRSAQAVISELAILNPVIFIECGGVSSHLYGILDCPLVRINEALVSAILYLLNDPKWRPSCAQFQMILAPFSDSHYKHTENEVEYYNKQEEREVRIRSSCLAALAAMRSWPGLITLYQPQNIALKSLMDLLLSPQENTRVAILDFLFELLRVPTSECYSSYEACLKERANLFLSEFESWRLHEGFVVAEAKASLPHIAKFRPNLIQNYFALILYTLIKNDLLSGLCTVIVSSPQHISIKATVLLGELLYQCDRNLPEGASVCHALPILMEKAAKSESEERVRASEAIIVLLSLSRHKLNRPKDTRNMSLYLGHLLSGGEDRDARRSSVMSESLKLNKWLSKDHDDIIHLILKETEVVSDTKDFSMWRWHQLIPILRWPSNSLMLLEDNIYRAFMKKLLIYFKPSSRLFVCVSCADHMAKIQAEALLLFCDLLIKVQMEDQEKFLVPLLSDISLCLMDVGVEASQRGCLLSPVQLKSTLGQYYFLAIGSLTRLARGYELVLDAGIFDQMMRILELSVSDIYGKLIASTLDYTINGVNRKIVNKILTKSKEGLRLYATQLLGVFVRARTRNFTRWGVELLINQLYDESRLVAFAALDVLDEALDDEDYLEAVLKVPPSVQHLGDRGYLLIAKLVGSPRGFRAYNDCNFISTLLDKWTSTFNLKYVKLIEMAVSECVTHLQRGDDGFYGRRTGEKHVVHDFYLLPHLFGSLALHKEGFSTLLQHGSVYDLLQILRDGSVSDVQEVYRLKAAIWALGNLGRSILGVNFLVSENVLPLLIQLAAQCPVYSVRGTVFHALCIVAVTWEGANELQKYGWASVRRHHHEIVQLNLREFHPLPREVGQPPSVKRNKIAEQSDSEVDEHLPRTQFYFWDESEDEGESISLLMDDLYSDDSSTRRSQTLPHDTRPSYMSHQRSFSDCVPVIEEVNGSSVHQSSQESTFSKRSRDFKKKLLSSFRRTSKHRDSVGSKTSNSSSASERMFSLFRPGRKLRTTSENSDREVLEAECHLESSEELGAERQLMENYNLHRLRPKIERGVSQSSHDDLQSREFLMCGTEQNSMNVEPSPSGCSELSSLRSSSALGSRGNSFRESAIPLIPEEGTGQCYLGLTLPLDLDKLLYDSSFGKGTQDKKERQGCDGFPVLSECEFQSHFKSNETKDLEKIMKANIDENSAFEFHSTQTCIACFRCDGRGERESATEEGEEKPSVSSPLDKTLDVSFDASSSQNSCDETVVNQPKEPLKNRYLVRKEVLRFVSNICNSFITKSAESGLLTLKHRLSWSFQDSCLYSEIFVLLSSYSYRLTARRFIQELFADLVFGEVFELCEQLLAENEKLYGSAFLAQKSQNDEEIDENDASGPPEYSLDDFFGFSLLATPE